MFWAGVIFLIVGVVLSVYGFVAVQSVFDELRALNTGPFQAYSMFAPPPALVLEGRLFLVQYVQAVGFGLTILGSVMFAYDLWGKNRWKPV